MDVTGTLKICIEKSPNIALKYCSLKIAENKSVIAFWIWDHLNEQ